MKSNFVELDTSTIVERILGIYKGPIPRYLTP
jgi:hypothetical protein